MTTLHTSSVISIGPGMLNGIMIVYERYSKKVKKFLGSQKQPVRSYVSNQYRCINGYAATTYLWGSYE